jgi:peptide alpha-N-acetyltransferase
LDNQPQNPSFWLGLAVAYQLVNEPAKGIKVLETQAESGVLVSYCVAVLSLHLKTI